LSVYVRGWRNSQKHGIPFCNFGFTTWLSIKEIWKVMHAKKKTNKKQKKTLSKLQFLDDNFYLVTVTKKIVMVTRK